MQVSPAIYQAFQRGSSRDGKAAKEGPIVIAGKRVNLATERGTKRTSGNSSGIAKVEYIPLNIYKGFMIATLKTNPTYLYKGQVKQGRSKGGQLTFPIAFKFFIKSMCDPANRPFRGVGTNIWEKKLLAGAGEDEGGESVYQDSLVQKFKAQKELVGNKYETITKWLQEGKLHKLQRRLNRKAMVKGRYTPEQLMQMYLKAFRF